MHYCGWKWIICNLTWKCRKVTHPKSLLAHFNHEGIGPNYFQSSFYDNCVNKPTTSFHTHNVPCVRAQVPSVIVMYMK